MYYYYCEDKFLYIYSDKLEKFCNLLEDPTDVQRKFYWDCPTFEIHDLMKANCYFAGAIKSDLSEPLTVSSVASGASGSSESVQLSEAFSLACPSNKICFNNKTKICCALVNYGGQWKCPSFCLE